MFSSQPLNLKTKRKNCGSYVTKLYSVIYDNLLSFPQKLLLEIASVKILEEFPKYLEELNLTKDVSCRPAAFTSFYSTAEVSHE